MAKDINQSKNKRRGDDAGNALDEIINELSENGTIKNDARKSLSELGIDIDKIKMADVQQERFLEFDDGKIWLLHSTTSISDRIRILYWNFMQTKKISKDKVEKCYVVYPDNIILEEKDAWGKFERWNQKKNSGLIDVPIDGAISQSEVLQLAEDRQYPFKGGRAANKRGKGFEICTARTLQNKSNLIKWSSNQRSMTGKNYLLYELIMSKVGIAATDIESITATCDEKVIGKTKYGGKPKTDVVAVIKMKNGSETFFTLSCKATYSKVFDVQQLRADRLCKLLKITDKKLKNLIELAQIEGGPKNLRKRNINKYNELTVLMKPYLEKLYELAFSGKGYETDEKQVAQYILCRDNDNRTRIKIYTVKEYIDELEKRVREKGPFGILTWTYPSGVKKEKRELVFRVHNL
ncbi:MAG: MspI family type II restriction endonuclease [Lachnospiraceae bacterium]|nr:MspI family type II restriction endonuclease [Lachnospiraceae bacterium]